LALKRELDPLLALGERSYSEDGLALAGVTDHVASRLEAYGYEVNRRGFAHGESIAQNLEVEVPGLRRGNQMVVVSARLDSDPGSPGADEASAVAALLVLAERFHEQRALRSVRFAFLSSAGPREQREAQGAFHYTRALLDDQKKEQAVVAAVELGGLGRYDDTPGSQRYPETVIGHGTAGNFVALVSLPEGTELAQASGSHFEAVSSLPFSHWVLPRSDVLFGGSAALEFADGGFQALLYTDTRRWRSEDLGSPGDVASRLDRDRLARVVAALEPAIVALSGPRGEAAEPDPEGLTAPEAGTPTE
jgi:hypothetical protein